MTETFMQIELKLLLSCTALALLQMLIAVQGAMSQVGLRALMANRENMPTITGWAGRARRAQQNLLENLVPFAILVLIAQVTGKNDATTALGAQVFFWARVAYVPVYVLGLPWVRTAVWTVSIVGLCAIFSQLI
jgi:uncharacterized MAPEG superfamily protein